MLVGVWGKRGDVTCKRKIAGSKGGSIQGLLIMHGEVHEIAAGMPTNNNEAKVEIRKVKGRRY